MKMLSLFSILLCFCLIGCNPIAHPTNDSPSTTAIDAVNDFDFPDYKDLSKLEAQEPFNQAYLPQKYNLTLFIDPEQKTIGGTVKIKIQKVESGKPLTIDMSDSLILDGVFIDSAPVPYTRVNNKLVIPEEILLGDKFEITIYYHSFSFRVGSHFIKQGQVNVQFWTHGEPLETRSWMPCFDWPIFKAPIESTIYVPKNWKVLSNGALKDSGNIGEQSYYHWNEKVKLPSYLYSILAGEFNVSKVAKTSVPMSFWIPPKEDPLLVKGFSLAPNMMKIYSNLFGDYVFSKFDVGIAYDFMGAMEHASNVTFSQKLSSQRDGYDASVLAHEMAHHWFGDLVTCKTWNDLWLNEGFANYFEVVFWEKNISKEKYFNRIESYKKRYIGEDVRHDIPGNVGPVYNPDTAASQKFNTASYTKGALVLHTLRYHLGDKVFFKAIKEYLEKYKFKSANTEDFKTIVENVSGQNLKVFFDQWIYKPAHPYFHYSWKWNKEKSSVELNTSQNQKKEIGLFETPIDVYLGFKTAHKTEKIFIRAQVDQTYEFKTMEEPEFVVLDPEHWVLSQTKAEKRNSEWEKILFNGPTTNSKIDALAVIDVTLGFDALNKFIESKPSGYLLSYAVLKLSKFKSEPKALFIARESLKSSDDNVRMSAAQVLGQMKDKESEDALIEVFESDPSSYVAMYAAMSLAQIGSVKSAQVFYRELFKEPLRDAKLLSMTVSGLQTLKYTQAGPRLLELLEDEQTLAPMIFMKMTVANALASFKETKATAAICRELLLEKNPGLSKGFISALTEMGDKSATTCLENIVQDKNRKPDVRQAAMAALKTLNSVKN